MNIKKFIMAVLIVFIIIQITNFIYHNLMMGATYEAMQGVWRPDMMDKMWLMYIVSIVFSSLFVYIFLKGFAQNGIKGGMQYGVVMSFLQPLIASVSQYVFYPIALSLAVQWFVFGLIQFVLCGIFVSIFYKSQSN